MFISRFAARYYFKDFCFGFDLKKKQNINDNLNQILNFYTFYVFSAHSPYASELSICPFHSLVLIIVRYVYNKDVKEFQFVMNLWYTQHSKTKRIKSMLLPGLDSNAPYLMTTSSCGQMLTMGLLCSIDFVNFQRKTFFFLKILFDQHMFVKLYVFSSFVKICINAFLCFECLVVIFQPLFFSLKVFQTLVLAFSIVWI